MIMIVLRISSNEFMVGLGTDAHKEEFETIRLLAQG